MDSFMKRIYELGRRLYEDPGLSGSPDVRSFVNASAEPLERTTADVAEFNYSIRDMLLDTWEFREWPELAWRRSALQFLVELYAGTPVERWLREQVEPENNDDMIRQKADEQNFVKPTDVPTGIPPSHWWWRRPTP